MSTTGRRVRFLADFDYKPTPQTTIAYKAGQTEFVRRECAERAIALGKAEPVDLPAPPAGISGTIAKRQPHSRKKANG